MSELEKSPWQLAAELRQKAREEQKKANYHQSEADRLHRMLGDIYRRSFFRPAQARKENR